MRRSTSVGTLSVAAFAGIGLGVAGFLLAPFDPGRDDNAAPPSNSPSPSASPSPGTTAPAPPFTREALLKPEELVRFGWGKAERTAVHDGAPRDLELLCFPGSLAAQDARDDHAGTYRGLQTEAAEVVARFPDPGGAERAFARLSGQVGRCAEAEGGLPATTGTRHEPRLAGVDRVVWWNTESNRTGSGERPRVRGVLGLAMVDDRLLALSLTSTSSDPASTVELEPLLSQAARRLV
ncbi:hypothetical protein ABZ929_00485 [Streptomyces physcomitrii]|uniref:hypothetical protein n=1 Tax=Streptomyces physcomitrii TaxID=2724184 RepID=UPI003411CA9B